MRGQGATFILDPVYVFKGKVRACSGRNKPSDATDVGWLEGRFRQMLQEQRQTLNLVSIGLAARRYPHLTWVFQRIGIDMKKAEQAAAPHSLERTNFGYPGDVQRGALQRSRFSRASFVEKFLPGAQALSWS